MYVFFIILYLGFSSKFSTFFIFNFFFKLLFFFWLPKLFNGRLTATVYKIFVIYFDLCLPSHLQPLLAQLLDQISSFFRKSDLTSIPFVPTLIFYFSILHVFIGIPLFFLPGKLRFQANNFLRRHYLPGAEFMIEHFGSFFSPR